MSSPPDSASDELPAVDRHLIAGEQPYEIDDGKLVHVPPAEEPHAVTHGALGALLRAHRAPGFSVAIDMLTRVSETTEIAPDACIYPSERDPATGGRRIEELAFEVLSTTTLADTAKRAEKLTTRGVRRVFALQIEKHRAFEWSRELGTWAMLHTDDKIEDPSLAVPLPIRALVDAAHADDAVVRAYREQRHPQFLAERQEGIEQGIQQGIQQGMERGKLEAKRATLVELATAKLGPLTPAQQARIAGAELAEIDRWLRELVTAATADDVFGRG